MKNNWKHYLSFGLTCLILSSTNLFAQDDFEEENECVRTLAEAEELYKDGLIEKVEQKLRPCLEGNQLSKEEKLQAYRLIIESKLFDHKEAEAQETMLMFLKEDPEYVPQSGVDTKEFIAMYNQHHTSPLYTVAPMISFNWANVQSYGERGAYNTGADTKEYSNLFGVGGGVRATRYLYKGLNVHLGLAIAQSGFSYTQDILEDFSIDNSNDVINPGKSIEITATETQTILAIPLEFSYTFLRQKQFRPYAMVGAQMRYLMGANMSITKNYLDPNIADIETSSFDNFKDERNDVTLSLSLGAGVKYKVKGGAFFVESQYLFGLSDQVKEDVVSTNDNQRLWTFHQLDNKFTLNHLFVSLGFEFYFYKPRKMKQKKSDEDLLIQSSSKKKEKKTKEKKEVDNSPPKKRQIIE